MNNHASVNQVFTVSPKIQLNLLLNFESYDISTQTEDDYMPEEKVIKFNPGYITLKVKGGKMRITQERVNGKAVKINKNVLPYGSFVKIDDEGKYILY